FASRRVNDIEPKIDSHPDTAGERLLTSQPACDNRSAQARRQTMIDLYRWVDPRVNEVRVADMRAYLQRHGWRQHPCPRPELLVVQGPIADNGKEYLIQTLPSSERSASYRQSLIELITNLAVIEDRLAVEVLNDILQADAAPPRNGAPRKPARK